MCVCVCVWGHRLDGDSWFVLGGPRQFVGLLVSLPVAPCWRHSFPFRLEQCIMAPPKLKFRILTFTCCSRALWVFAFTYVRLTNRTKSHQVFQPRGCRFSRGLQRGFPPPPPPRRQTNWTGSAFACGLFAFQVRKTYINSHPVRRFESSSSKNFLKFIYIFKYIA
jgi:hypothetical protein